MAPVKITCPEPVKITCPEPVKITCPEPVKITCPEPVKVICSDLSTAAPNKVICPEPTAAGCTKFVKECQDTLKRVVAVRDAKIKDFGSCNSSLFEERRKTEKIPALTKALSECETGYGGCNDTLASMMFKELTINFTWANESSHLRIDLEDAKEDLTKCRVANSSLTGQYQSDKKKWEETKSKLDSRVYSLQMDNGLVERIAIDFVKEFQELVKC